MLFRSGQLNKAGLEDYGFTAQEIDSILADKQGRLRDMQRRLRIANALTPAKLAAMLRARLSEQIERLEDSRALSSLLRSLKGLPQWLFPEWQKQEQGMPFDGLMALAGGLAAGQQRC